MTFVLNLEPHVATFSIPYINVFKGWSNRTFPDANVT